MGSLKAVSDPLPRPRPAPTSTGGSDSKESAYNTGEPGWEDPLEKGMATHSSILAWRTPGTEEPGGLQSQTRQK